jgi:hypothetical protein
MIPIRRLALSLGSALAMSMSIGAGAALADPSTPTTLVYTFTNCTSPAGSVADFEAVKQPGDAAALHLADGTGTFVVMSAIDELTGATLFATPGFEKNGLPEVSCDSIHPVTRQLARVSGLITPVSPR